MSDLRDDRMDDALRAAFQELPSAALDGSFHARLAQRLALEAPRRRATLRMRLMRLYWIAALAVSFAIIGGLPWNAELATRPFPFVLLIFGGVCLVPALLLRRLGWADLLLDLGVEPGER